MRPWQDIAAEEQARVLSELPKEWLLTSPPADNVANVMQVPYTCGLLSDQELEWTDKDATELLGLLASGEVKSYDLTLAFCKRAAIAQQLLNCMTEMWFEEALQRARELDNILAKTGKTVGPFHGLPFSIKCTFAIKGKRSSSCYVGWAKNVADQDAPIVKVIRDAGAVLFCKTTNPQTVMHLETVSNLFGRTLNPYNRQLTPGGSSGGEAALVAIGGSPIGLAADGGGSIRSPAANNGLFGMKCTPERIPIFRGTLSQRGCKSYPIVAGPVTRTVRDSELFMKAVLDAETWRIEPSLVPLPWRSIPMPEKIKIGVYTDDLVCKPHPPITYALNLLKEKIRAHPAFELIEWTPYKHGQGYDIIRQLFWEDGGVETKAIMEDAGEPILPLTQWVMKAPHIKARTLKESWELNYQRDVFQKEYLQHWQSAAVVPDFLVGPVGPSAAPRHETARYWGYTAVFNLLDYPACSFPTGLFCFAASHPADLEYQPRDNEFDAYNWNNYDAKIFEGAPISLQVAGRKWDCERTLRAAGLMTELFGVDRTPSARK
ncbi:hypothetical protein A1O3_05247 [Capronia epimyces CBS 606.96]|uniref:amidase n=1 Tax=Capronia epimyces CBS 606.96 TaxID=1182542 RepID=W9XVI5_9EURO|nr:uncharacterized protein A1O3_05247 [Capronia epimyces CBS 606.96]EXJ84577.1 hypothetical protein A1O3_05247 [Capronia epimyces CBS 606.96]